jgi:hypothetical protein
MESGLVFIIFTVYLDFLKVNHVCALPMKLSGFKGISQGFLEDDMERSDTGVLISKNSCFNYS